MRPSCLYLNSFLYSSGSQPWAILFSKGHVTMCGDTCSCHNLRGAAGIQWVEAREAAKHLTMPRAAPQQRFIWPNM